MDSASPAPRRRHTDLQPLSTRTIDPPRRSSTQSQGSPCTNSNTTLPSPSVVAARAYFLELISPIAPVNNAATRHRSLIQGQQAPRRHSLLPSTGSLVSQLENFTFAFVGNDLQPVLEVDEPECKIKTEALDMCISHVKECPAHVGTIQKVRDTNFSRGTIREVLRQVPFQYTHCHLRDWGYAYLGNSDTADAFVNAVSLRRASLALAKEDDFRGKAKTSALVTVRARVLPKAKERKPFLIQRQFDIHELRLSIPKAQLPGNREGSTQNRPRRSRRLRRSSAWQAGETPRKGAGRTLIAERSCILGHGAVPIHIEYALHYLPVLGALMLSGHVRKGDTIDLPIPHPEVWHDTIAHIYTGRGEMGVAVEENISYLAGHSD